MIPREATPMFVGRPLGRRRGERTGASSEDVVFQDAPEDAEGVFPSDLLSLCIGPPIIRDPDLKDAAAGFCYLGDDLNIKAEAVLLDLDPLDVFPTKDLVASLDVCEIEVGEDVGKQGEHAVADPVPEIEHPMRLAAEETRAEDDVCPVLEDGLEELGVLGRVVFE